MTKNTLNSKNIKNTFITCILCITINQRLENSPVIKVIFVWFVFLVIQKLF